MIDYLLSCWLCYDGAAGLVFHVFCDDGTEFAVLVA